MEQPKRLCEIGDVIAIDGSRYVVEVTVMDGGGSMTGMNGFPETYPNGHHVYARRLNPDGAYNPQGESMDFWQTGFFTRMLPNPCLVGKMRRTFVPE